MLRGLVVWPAVCALFVALEILGLADELSLPVPLILALVGARLLAEAGWGHHRQRLAVALAMGLAGLAALVWGPGLALGTLSPRAELMSQHAGNLLGPG